MGRVPVARPGKEPKRCFAVASTSLTETEAAR